MFHKFDAAERFQALGSELLDQKGISLRHGSNFDEFRDLVAQARPDHTIGDSFNPDKVELSAPTASWVVGYDVDGNLMHTQAFRQLSIKDATLADYLRKNFCSFPPPDLDIDFDKSRYRAGPGAKRITGKVVYSGETWIGGTPGQYRGTGLSALLGRYAMLTAIQNFRPDYMMGFITRPVAHAGYVIRFGFMHAEPMALRWQVKDVLQPIDCFMAYMSAEDMEFLLELSSSEIEALAA